MNRAYSILTVKAVEEDQRILTGIATTPEPDRIGDIVEPLGVKFKNPLPLLHQHESDQPVGTVRFDKPTADGITFKAQIPHVAEPGPLKDRVDTAWGEVRAGLVRGVSIGFRALEHAQLKSGGIRFIKSEVLELSLVTVPANQSATIHTIKSLDTAQRAVSGQPTPQRVVHLNPPSVLGHPQRKPEEGAMKTIAEQISALENKRAASASRMDAVMQKSLDEDRTTDAAEQEEFDTLATEVEALDKDITRLRKLENTKALAATPVVKAETAHQGTVARGGIILPYAVPAQKVVPQDHVWHSLVCLMKAHSSRRSPYEILKEEYGDDEPTRAVMNVLTKAATVPADTVTSGWASNLVATSIGEFFSALMANAVYPSLAAKGGKFSFGRSGIVSMPTRASTPTIAGSFVAQGAPIPVRQGAFTSISFTPKKMGVISTFTREIAEHSTPAIDGLIRQAIIEDTSVAIDSVLLDATAATTTRPAGLRSGVAAVTATAGGGINALIGDIRGLTSALITGTNGNLRSPVWIMNPADVLAASLLPATAGGGEFPFKSELAGGTLQGYPVIQSANVTADMMILIDAADFISVTGDSPRFDVSDQATLHMEDTTPLAISTTGSPNVVAAPVRSLYQTDCVGVRMLMDINWGLRRTGVVAWTQTMTWN